MDNSEEIKELILVLHQNDVPEIYPGSMNLTEPIRAINRLIELGHEGVPYLINELKEYKKEGEERYYPEYIIKILGAIGDIRALDIMASLVNDKLALWDVDITTNSIAKLGREVVPFYLRKIEKSKSEEELVNALWVFGRLEEKDPDALIFAKNILQQHKNFDLKEFAIVVIGSHGSQNEVKILEKYLESKNRDLRDVAKESIQRLLKENPAKVRDILTTHNIIGKNRCEMLGREIEREFNSSGFRYSQKEKFHGGNASELNEAVSEYFTRKPIIEFIYKLNSFGADEGLLSEEQQDKLLDVWRNLSHIQEKHLEQYRDAISLFDSYHVQVDIQSEEIRSFKGMYPIPKKIFQKIKKWSLEQGFETSQVDYDMLSLSHYILARKNNKKGYIVYLTKTDGKRKWANIGFRIIGNDWSSNELIDMQKSFWNQFDDLKNLV